MPDGGVPDAGVPDGGVPEARPEHEQREAAHDFNNLLTAIIGAADAVLERAGVDAETRADIVHIREGARRGAILVRPMRGEARDTRDFISVNETIRATWRLLEHRLGPGVALRLDLAEPDGWVIADAAQLDRALLNMISNARHAMPGGGVVTLGTTRRIVAAAAVPIPGTVPDIVPLGDYVVIEVADTGIGIPRDQLSRIFEAGVSSKRRSGGSGLGLASAREIVRGANGHITVESVEGQGTCFAIWLPWVAVPAPDIVASPVRDAASRTALVVEDDLLVRHILERGLPRAGWTVRCVGTAEDALDSLRHDDCDLVVTDIALPDMDGLELTRALLAGRPDLPVILMSGYAVGSEANAFPAVNVAFLTKPYGQEELVAAIARLLPDKTVLPG